MAENTFKTAVAETAATPTHYGESCQYGGNAVVIIGGRAILARLEDHGPTYERALSLSPWEALLDAQDALERALLWQKTLEYIRDITLGDPDSKMQRLCKFAVDALEGSEDHRRYLEASTVDDSCMFCGCKRGSCPKFIKCHSRQEPEPE